MYQARDKCLEKQCRQVSFLKQKRTHQYRKWKTCYIIKHHCPLLYCEIDSFLNVYCLLRNHVYLCHGEHLQVNARGGVWFWFYGAEKMGVGGIDVNIKLYLLRSVRSTAYCYFVRVQLVCSSLD